MEALDAYFSALLDAALTDESSEELVDIEELLLMFVRAGAHLEKLLEQWGGTETPLARRRLAGLAEGIQVRGSGWRLGSPFWEDRPAAEFLVAQWLVSPVIIAQLDEALLSSTDELATARLLHARDLLLHLPQR